MHHWIQNSTSRWLRDWLSSFNKRILCQCRNKTADRFQVNFSLMQEKNNLAYFPIGLCPIVAN